MAWNWYDYVLTGLTSGVYGAGKAASDWMQSEQAKAEKEKTDRLSDVQNKAKQAYLDLGYDEAAADEAARKYVESIPEGQKETISFIDPNDPAFKALASGNKESFAEKSDTNNYFSLKNLQNAPAEARDARELAAAEDDVSRQTAYRTARNQGANRAASQAIAGSDTPVGNQSNAATTARSASSSTQNDWLAKQGYSNALDMQSQNLQKGQFLNTIGAIFGGAGTGAQTGSALASK